MTTTTTPQVQAYAAAVRAALADLPAAHADGLLDGLEPHLEEVVAEGGASLVDALGPPDRYAAELRASAGLVGPDPSRWSTDPLAAAPPPTPPLLAKAGLTAEPATAPSTPPAKPHRTPLRELARTWWGAALVVLAVLAVAGAAAQSDPLDGADVVAPVVAIGVGLAAVALLVRRGVPDRWRDPATAVLVVAAITAAVLVGAELPGDDPVDVGFVDQSFLTATTMAATAYVPDVVGLSIDDATAQLASIGVSVEYDGFPAGGLAVVTEQDPPAGSLMPSDYLVALRLADEVGPTTTTPGPLTTEATAAGVTTTIPETTTPITVPPPG